MDAILLAGGIPGVDDPLYAYTAGIPKAMLSIHGKPMVQYVLDSLSASEAVNHIYLIGLDETSPLTAQKPLTFSPDTGDLLQNALSGLQLVRAGNPTADRVLIVSSDIPAITPEIIDMRIADAMEHDTDIDYALVERATMEARFPEANRSYVRLKDVEVCGGDLNLVRIDIARNEGLWSRIVDARKSAFRQASLIGFDILIKMLFRRITLHDAEDQISERLGLRGRAAISPHAEVAMDVDKPEQLQVIANDLPHGHGP
jgi:GTP:adenosylcobinamide-phosphate guanylyltransferase